MQVDVVIVGGGPAGMVAACLLARNNIKTLVLESNPNFDREFRGEILQPRFQKAMRDVGLYDHVSNFPHEEIDGAQVYFHGFKVGQVEAKRLDKNNPKIWWMTQPHLLEGLHDYAKRLDDFEILFDSKADTLTGSAGNLCLNVKRGSSNLEIKTKLVIGADGRFSTVRRMRDFEVEYDHHDMDIMWFQIDRPKGFGSHFFGFFLGMLNPFLILPKYPNKLQCGMVLRPGTFGKVRGQGLKKIKSKLKLSHPLFKKFAHELEDFKSFTLLIGNRAMVKDWIKDGVILVGDSAHTCSPAGGIGVAVAVETAIVSANRIIEALQSNDLSDEFLFQIQKERKPQVKLDHAFQGQGKLALNPIFYPLRLLAPPFIFILTFFKIAPLFAKRIFAQRKALNFKFR